jgi:quinol monooxygenase YgiN
MTAIAGQRDALIAILLEGVADMPGCLSYVVAKAPADANAIWITEVWDSQASHKTSLSLPSVKQAIVRKAAHCRFRLKEEHPPHERAHLRAVDTIRAKLRIHCHPRVR